MSSDDHSITPLIRGSTISASQNTILPIIPDGTPGTKAGSLGLDFTNSVYVRGVDGIAYNLNSLTPVLTSLTVTGITTLQGITTINGATTVNNNLTVTGTSTLQGTTTISGATTINNNLTVTGTSTLQGTTTVNGATTINNTLSVTGLTALGNVTVNGYMSMPVGAPQNTTKLFNMTTGGGPPTSTLADGVKPGSLYYDDTNNVLYVFDGAVWTGISRALTNGQVLIGSTGNPPVAATISSGAGITVTSVSGSITVANTGVISVTGTANQITAAPTTGAAVLSLPTTLSIPGLINIPRENTVGGFGTVSFAALNNINPLVSAFPPALAIGSNTMAGSLTVYNINPAVAFSFDIVYSTPYTSTNVLVMITAQTNNSLYVTQAYVSFTDPTKFTVVGVAPGLANSAIVMAYRVIGYT